MPAGTVYTDKAGNRRIRTGSTGASIFWDDHMLYMLRRYFPNTPNDELSDLCGVSPRTVVRKARELGLTKSQAWLNEKNNRGLAMMRAINRTGKNTCSRFRKGVRQNPSGEFKPGHLPVNARKVIRLDTLEVYESGATLARALGRAQTAVSHAVRRNGKCAGVKVMFYDSYLRVEERRRLSQPPKQESWKEKASRINRKNMGLDRYEDRTEI